MSDFTAVTDTGQARRRSPTASVVIGTFNRASYLADTLESIAATRAPGLDWDVVVVDNNSTDATREVVARYAASYPVPLQYVFEREQGFAAARNAGIAASTGELVILTDDDVRVSPDWLSRMVGAFEEHRCDYVAGRVLPLWEREPPEWFPRRNGMLWGVIAILDYGPEPAALGRRVPLGVNMGVRRGAFDRIGLLDTSLGRKPGTLLGGADREWCLRARAAGLAGWYVPDAVVHHLIPAARLTRRYFRRWFYWRGVTRALLYARSGVDMERPEESRLDFQDVPHVLGVPRYLFRNAARRAVKAVAARLRNRPAESFEHELWLWTFAGIARQRWIDRHVPPGSQRPPEAVRAATPRV